ncbi:MAG TPA: UDP binding domain-containing protein, partial [Thermoanaerobaculia bacterium]|nr:UDP binding domain-containing protein [Thermoanaerobaculia bacterium]
GSCFPKDTRAVSQIAHDQGMTFRIIDAVLDANEATKRRMVDKVTHAVGGVEGKTLAILGLSFKPDTDDIRESPAMEIAEALIERGATLRCFDPEAMEEAAEELDATFCDNAYEAADGAEALVILTEWNQFRKLELDTLKERLARPLIVDLRNIYEPKKIEEAGFRYVSVGRREYGGEAEGA